MTTILQGDVLTMLRGLPADSVHCVVTSPPYWGLRDYGVEGQIGLEPTIGEFIEKLVAVFEEVRRVLRPDGTCWVNMGDSYAGSRGGGSPSESSTLRGNGHTGGGPKVRSMTASRRRDNESISRSDYRIPGLKPKDLVGQPWRLAFALQDAGWWLRSEIIWHKPNPMPESTKDRPTKAHEQLFLFTKSERYAYYRQQCMEPVTGGANARRPSNGVGFGHGYDAVPKPLATWKTPDGWGTSKGQGGHGSFHKEGREKGTKQSPDALVRDASVSARMGRGAGWRKLAEAGSGTKNNTSFDEAMAVMPTERGLRTVWTIASEPYPEAHFATFPTEIPRRCILLGSPTDGLVLDPFNGSGTTGQVALELGRRYIGIELNPDYVELTHRRLRGVTPGLQLDVA